MKAFQDDLRQRGLEERVLSLTFSEFGRRAQANNSYGSDHGTLAPMLIFGKNVNAGIIGSNPDLSRVAQHNGNLPDGAEDVLDYRTVFNTILQDWFEVSPDKIPLVLPSLQTGTDSSNLSVYDKQPIFCGTIAGLQDFISQRYWLGNCHPNPVHQQVQFKFHINNRLPVRLAVYNLQAKLCYTILEENLAAGLHECQADLTALPAGTYLYRLEAGQFTETKRLIKV